MKSTYGPNATADFGSSVCAPQAFESPGIVRVIMALLGLLFFLSGPAGAAAIKVSPDRDLVRKDESFNLVFTAAESVDDDPDFSPLEEDFEILGRNQGSQVSIVNGKFSKKQEWTVTVSPKHSGAITIPSIAFGKDRSPPASVTVLENSAGATNSASGERDADIFLEVDAEPKSPYVQAQVIYTVRVLLRVNLAGADLSEPVAGDALIERLGDDHRYSTSRGGRDYTVIERKYALFPQKSGLLRVDPMQLTAQVEVGASSFFARPTRAMRVKSESIDLKVRSIPLEFAGKHWLPAAKVQLEETWSPEPAKARPGEPLTRTLSLRAQGSTVGVLPELGTGLTIDPSIKQYPDQPALNEEKDLIRGISGVREEKIALIPERAGEFALPAVEIPWWNTKADRMEIARIPGRVFRIVGSGEPMPQPSASETAPKAAAQSTTAEGSLPGIARIQLGGTIWFWVALFLASGWAATGYAWWRSRRGSNLPEAAGPVSSRTGGESAARKALENACANHDPQAARLALLDWMESRDDGRRPTALTEVANLTEGPLSEEIKRLNRALYGNAVNEWRGDALWAAFARARGDKREKEREREGLKPLYPLP